MSTPPDSPLRAESPRTGAKKPLGRPVGFTLRKPLPVLLLSGLLAAGFVHADEFSDLLRRVMGGRPAPAQPAPPAPPAAPAQPAPPAAPATTSERPRDQLLRALLSGNPSQEEEVRIGQQIAGNLLGAVPLVRDDALQRYVNRVGRWVALQSERPDLAWQFGVIDSDAINAFAAPGGYVFVTKGLYRKLRNEAELAGVLAHEIAHVLRRHHLRLLRQSQGIAALGGLLGRQLRNESELLQNLIGNGAEIVARGLDKDAEFEADRIGMVLTARAGYDVYALPAVLAELGHIARDDRSVALLFKTHPPPADRLEHLAEAAGDRLENVPEGQTGEKRFRRLR